MPTTTHEFLKWVLPDDGHYALWIKDTKRHRWFDSSDRLAVGLLECDQAEQSAYFACAAFTTTANRLGKNARSVKSFWLDVDAGPDKPYEDAAQAAEAVLAFCRDVQLPVPIYVASGYGIYAIWPLDAELAPDVWRSYASGLKRICHDQKLFADPTRTSDVASILRAPGTHNRKYEKSVEVQCGPLVGPYPIEAFGRLLDGQDESKPLSRKSNRDVETPVLARALSETVEHSPRFSGEIALRCRQLGLLRDTRGRLAEPLWYGCLGVLAYCEDGSRYAHEWSNGYDGYAYEETQERLERAKRLSGATTCEHFHSLDPKTCEACPHWGKIKSPISLGRKNNINRSETETASTTDVFGQALADHTEHQESQTEKVNEQALLPDGFHWSKDGALVARSGARGGDVDVVVSRWPLYLDSVQSGEVRGEHSLIFKQRLPQRDWSTISLSAATVFGSASTAELAAKGANIHDHNSFIRYVRGAIDLLHAQNKMTTRYDQFGWKHDNSAFLYGLDLYGPQGATRVPGSDELQVRCKEDWVGPCRGGNLEVWKQTVNALFALGCEPHSVALLAAFAAPLIHFQDREEGGAIIHLVSRESGKGKSTALVASASVWGRPKGLGLTNEDTKVTKALTLGALGNLPVIYDELTLRDPEAIRSWVITFTNGRDKMRATRAGEIKHTASGWQTVLVSAANTSLVDLLSMQDHPEAPAMRVLEFPATLPESIQFAGGDKLKDRLLANSGHAGAYYLEWLMQPANLKFVREQLEQCTQAVWARDIGFSQRFESKHRFWVRTIAAILVAGVCVKGLRLVDFSIERIKEWIFDQIKNKLTTGQPQEWSVPALSAFLDQSISEKLVVPGPFEYGPGKHQTPSHTPTRRLSIRQEVHSKKIYIATNALREWLVDKELSYKEFTEALIKANVMAPKTVRIVLGAGTDWSGGQVTAIEIHSDAIAGVSNVVPIRPPTQAPAFPLPGSTLSGRPDD